MDLKHLAWPFFTPRHRAFATRFDEWASGHLVAFEDDEGNDGQAARTIFELLAGSDWLKETLPEDAS